MSCCGGGRDAFRRSGPPASAPRAVPGARPAGPGTPSAGGGAWAAAAAEVEYRGAGRLTVTGPLTGTVYRFESSGARVRVHGPDVPSLATIPTLRVIR